jgi:hypothetical protein
MSLNDVLALNANIQNWTEDRAQGLAESIQPFVYYCVEQFLKPYDISDEEILYGITDGGNDGGIDALYFLVNGVLVREDTKLDTKADKPKVNLIMFQMKNSGGFSPTEVNKFTLFTDDLLALSVEAKRFKIKYHSQLIEIMQVFKDKYLQVAGNFPELKVDYYYISKIDEQQPDAKAIDAADKLKEAVKKHFSKALTGVYFINAQGLLEQAQARPQREKTISWAEQPMATKEGYVGLVNLRDYFNFIKDENNNLAEKMLEANVRGYQGEVTVNKQIRQTLETKDSMNFWLLNNGITVVASEEQTAGHLKVTLKDPQIVNGLQTSREIFDYFTKNIADDERKILVRVIITPETVVQDAVIRATNNQTKLPEGALRTTEPIHHKIEDLFKQADLYYDRRKGVYKDRGKPISKIVSVTELIQAFVSILLQRPDDARRRPSDYLTKEDQYNLVFDADKYSLSIYLKCVQILRKVHKYIQTRNELDRVEKLNVKFYVAMLAACRLAENSKPSVEQLEQIKVDDISDALLSDCVYQVWSIYVSLAQSGETVKGPDILEGVESYMKKSLSGKTEVMADEKES